jgi:integrase
MPVRKREGSPFFWYSFSLGGRRFRGSTRKTTLAEAKEVERELYQLARKNQLRTGEWPLLMVLNAYWHEKAKDHRGHRTIETNLASLQKLLGSGLKASKLTGARLLEYRAIRRGEGVQAHTVNREFAYLRAAYEHCRAHHSQPLPDVNWKTLKAKEPDWRTRFLSRTEYNQLMAVAHPDIRPIILCAVATGLRKDNILSLDWRNVSLDDKLIQVVLKGGRRHSVRISPPLMAALSSMPHRKGKVFATTNFRKRWDAAVKTAGIEDFRFHDLRHTFASWARQDGADIADVCDALGHTSVQMSMRYAHVKPDEAITAFDRVSDRLWAQSETQAMEKRRK